MFVVSIFWNPIHIKLRDTFIKSKLFFAHQNPSSFSLESDAQLKWILANKNEYKEDFVLAAMQEIAKREQPFKYKVLRLINKIFYLGDKK